MRFSIAALVRNLRRQRSSSLGGLGNLIYGAPVAKHFKIDDEERQIDIKLIPGRGPIMQLVRMLLIILVLLVFLIILLAYIIYKPPLFIIRFFQWKNPQVLFYVPVPPSQRVVALTLDDAPSDQTSKILDLLQAYHAKATFFIIGSQVSDRSDLIKRMHSEGHETGNHAWKDEPSFELPLSELARQIKDVEDLLPANANGRKYFRPGSGFFNKKMVQSITDLGYKVVLGGVYPHDPQIQNPRVNAKHVLSMVKPGSIIIMHDRRSYSAEQLELVLGGLTAKGWRVESLGGLLRIAETANGEADKEGKQGG